MQMGNAGTEPWDVIAAAARASPDAREAAGAISRMMPEALTSLGEMASGIGLAAEDLAGRLAPFLFPSGDDGGIAHSHRFSSSGLPAEGPNPGADCQVARPDSPEPGHHDIDFDWAADNGGPQSCLRLMSLRSVLQAARVDWGLAASLALGPSSCPLACLNPRCSNISAAAAAAGEAVEGGGEAVELDSGLGAWNHVGLGVGHSCQGCGFLHCCGNDECFKDAKERGIHTNRVCLALKMLGGTVEDHSFDFEA